MKTVEEYRADILARNADINEEYAKLFAERMAASKRNHEYIMQFVHRASSVDYAIHLAKFVANGGIPTHAYPYPSTELAIYKVKQSFTARPLYGANAIIMLAKDSDIIEGDLGHSSVIYSNGKLVGHYAPIFSDC